jgi:hypothetical protein
VVRDLGSLGRVAEIKRSTLRLSLSAFSGHLYFLSVADAGGSRGAVFLNATLGYTQVRPAGHGGNYETTVAKCQDRLRRKFATAEPLAIPMCVGEVLPTVATTGELPALARRCDEGDASACYDAALLSAPARRLSSDFAKTVEYYRRACDMGEPRACARIHSLEP